MRALVDLPDLGFWGSKVHKNGRFPALDAEESSCKISASFILGGEIFNRTHTQCVWAGKQITSRCMCVTMCVFVCLCEQGSRLKEKAYRAVRCISRWFERRDRRVIGQTPAEVCRMIGQTLYTALNDLGYYFKVFCGLL